MIRINLLPVRAAKKKESIRFQTTVAGLVTFFVLALLIIVYVSLRGNISTLNTEIKSFEKEQAELEKRIGELVKIKEQKKVVEEKLAVVTRLEKARKGPVELFSKISKAIPEKATLEYIKDSPTIVTLRGFAENEAIISDFMRGLQRYEELGTVELSVAKRGAVGKSDSRVDVIDFTLVIEKKVDGGA